MEIFILNISETPLSKQRKQKLRVLREFFAYSAFKSNRVGYLMTPLPMLMSFDAEAVAVQAAHVLLVALRVTFTVYLPRGSWMPETSSVDPVAVPDFPPTDHVHVYVSGETFLSVFSSVWTFDFPPGQESLIVRI